MEKELKVHKELKRPTLKWVASKYSDHPEGQDLSGKLLFCTKMAGLGGILTGLVALNYPPRPRDLMGKIARTSQFAIPALGMGITFPTVVYLSTNYRGKDDQLNYVLGGATAGSLLGIVGRAGHWAVLGILVGGLCGFIQKTCDKLGTTVITPVRRQEFSSYFQHRMDTSLIEERKGNWTKEPKS